MFENLEIESVWKNTIKLSLIFCFIASLMFYFVLFCFIVSFFTKNNLLKIDKKFILYSIFIFQFVFISYSLSIFVINSTATQQKKYRFLWLFLFVLGLNPIGFIGILILINSQNKNNITVKIKDKKTMIKNEKWFMLWALYSSIGMMIFIITIPLSIINLINIKKNWKKEEIEIKKLNKMAYFSSDITLMIASKSAF